MDIIDNLIESYNIVVGGLEKAIDNEDYVFVKDENENIIYTLYNKNKEWNLLDKYLEANNLSRDDVSITIMDTLESKDLEEIFKEHKITY